MVISEARRAHDLPCPAPASAAARGPAAAAAPRQRPHLLWNVSFRVWRKKQGERKTKSIYMQGQGFHPELGSTKVLELELTEVKGWANLTLDIINPLLLQCVYCKLEDGDEFTLPVKKNQIYMHKKESGLELGFTEVKGRGNQTLVNIYPFCCRMFSKLEDMDEFTFPVSYWYDTCNLQYESVDLGFGICFANRNCLKYM